MHTRGVQLLYRFQSEGQSGAQIENPLFDLLTAVHDAGSIQHAAKALGASYRHVWGQLKHWEQVMGEPLVTWTQGQPARLTPFAERLRWAEARARVRLTPHIEALRAELERVLAEALDGDQQVLTVFASHDLALPLLRERARDQHQLHIDLRFAGSMDALRALTEGRCGVAGFHVPGTLRGEPALAKGLKALLKPGRHKLLGCTRRTQGLMVAAGNPLALHDLPDVVRLGVRFAHRQAGSGTRLLTDLLLRPHGLDPAQLDRPGTVVEDSHLAVATAVASGEADAGVGIEAAARQFGLDFIPLVEEDYFLVCLSDALEQPAVQALRRALADPGWQDLVLTLPGYAPVGRGEVLSLTRALPWWNFRAPKAER